MCFHILHKLFCFFRQIAMKSFYISKRHSVFHASDRDCMDIFRSGQNIREACTADIGKGCRQNDLCQKTAVIGHHHLPLVLIIKIIHSAFHQMHLRSVVKVLDLHIFQRFQLPLSHTFCTVKRILWCTAFPALRGSLAIPSRRCPPRSHSWKQSWAHRCSTAWARPCGSPMRARPF